MALPMDEQRILEQMERMLAADDPRLAARLAAFGQPGFGQVLHTRRARATLSLMALVIIAAVAAVIYLMSAFRLNIGTNPPSPHHQTQAHTMPKPAPTFNAVHCAATWAPACAGSSMVRTGPGMPRAGNPASALRTSASR